MTPFLRLLPSAFCPPPSAFSPLLCLLPSALKKPYALFLPFHSLILEAVRASAPSQMRSRRPAAGRRAERQSKPQGEGLEGRRSAGSAASPGRIYTKKPREAWASRGLEGGGYLLSRFRSTIGAAGFNFSVRNGKRWNPRAIAA